MTYVCRMAPRWISSSILLFLLFGSIDAFLVQPRLCTPSHQVNVFRNGPSALNLVPMDVTSSTLIIADASWRQYLSLVVISGVLLDIVLGSPIANMALKPMRGDDDPEDADSAAPVLDRSKERVDTEKYAQAALDRAEGVLELRRFLDESKSDWDRMEDMKRKLDSDMQDLDVDLKSRENALAKRRNPK